MEKDTLHGFAPLVMST